MGRFTIVLALVTILVPAVAFGQTETVVYFHTDAVGSVRMVTDEAGAVIAAYDYWPFGVPVQSGTETRRFGGKERDAETAFDYFGARHSAGPTGRFTTVDPEHVGGDIFDPQSWNAYAYALNNPLRFVDPMGTCSQDAQGNYVDDDDAGTLVAPGPCPRGKDGALTIDLTETVSVKSKPAIVVLAEGVSLRAGPIVPLVGAAADTANVVLSVTNPVASILANCVIGNCSAGGVAMSVMPTGRFWKALRPFRGKTKTNGLTGSNRRFYEADRTHGDIEVYDARGRHLGSANPETGAVTKPAVPGRRIDVR